MQSPLKWYGGKTPLGSRLRALAPPHLHRVHAYGGGLGEFWNWPHEEVSEVVNDVNHLLTNFFRVLQSKKLFPRFKRQAQAIPFSEVEWRHHYGKCLATKSIPRTSVAAAVSLFVCCRQSRAGECREFAPLSRRRLRRDRNEQVSAWLTAIEGLPEVHTRLLRVVIKETPALQLIRKEDTEHTFFYLDPPYLHQTRSSTAVYGQDGEHEMTEEQHEELLQLITSSELSSQFMISGYNSDLYESYLGNWRKVEFDRANSVAGGSTKRRMVECVWMNY
jgi:DNA adenine methylase